MNKEELQKKIDEIDSEISKINYDCRKAIHDGIVDIDEYLSSETKIMWILKEVHSVGDNGEWDLRAELRNLKNETGTAIRDRWAGTFNPIVYITYGILNEKLWDEIPNTWDDPKIIDILNKIAYVNVKKVSGMSTANHNELKEFHRSYGQILRKQIDVFLPDVIICGNVLEIIDYFGNDYIEIRDENMIFYQSKSGNHILIDTYHPYNRKLKQQVYCDTIIKHVLDWKKTRKS